MSRAMRRASRQQTSRGRRTPVPRGSAGGLSVPWIPIALMIAIAAVVGVVIYLVIQAGKPAADRFADAAKMEEDPAPNLPGQYVNLPEAFAVGSTQAHYGSTTGPNTNSHVTRDVDYSKETSASAPNGLPPAGGPHWGSTTCGSDPAAAPAFCGPIPWGIYRAEWHAESFVHNMEHGGVVIWYNLSDRTLRDQIEAEVAKLGKNGAFVVMAPYSAIPANTIAFTAWARREILPADQYDNSKLDEFTKTFNCRFNPEGFTCGKFSM